MCGGVLFHAWHGDEDWLVRVQIKTSNHYFGAFIVEAVWQCCNASAVVPPVGGFTECIVDSETWDTAFGRIWNSSWQTQIL